jgi:glyoxylate reductase
MLRDLLEPLCVLEPWDRAADEDVARRARGLFTYGHPRVDGALLDRFPGLRVVSNFGVGIDHIDVAAASSRGIEVGNTPGAVDGATADMAMALLLASARNVVAGDRFARGPEFTHYDPSILLGTEVHGSTLGIFGMGSVGSQVARRARGFDMRVLYHNRRRRPEKEEELGVEYTTKEQLLSSAHFVCLTLPLTAETSGYIGRSELGRMRPDAVLINIARGAVVDHGALLEALVEKRIRGAALDVTDPEPLPRDHPILGLESVVITPHLGSAAERTRRRMAEMAAANLKAGLEGAALPWAVARMTQPQ